MALRAEGDAVHVIRSGRQVDYILRRGAGSQGVVDGRGIGGGVCASGLESRLRGAGCLVIGNRKAYSLRPVDGPTRIKECAPGLAVQTYGKEQ